MSFGTLQSKMRRIWSFAKNVFATIKEAEMLNCTFVLTHEYWLFKHRDRLHWMICSTTTPNLGSPPGLVRSRSKSRLAYRCYRNEVMQEPLVRLLPAQLAVADYNESPDRLMTSTKFSLTSRPDAKDVH